MSITHLLQNVHLSDKETSYMYSYSDKEKRINFERCSDGS